MRDLRKELKDPVLRLNNRPSSFQCVLDTKLTCCHGRGFRLEASGTYTKARLCDCVVTCPRCYGKAMKIEGGKSKPCRDFSPRRFVNIINGASIPSRYGDASLENFANLSGNGREIIQFAKDWCRNFTPNVSKGVIIGGKVGVGKTYLISAIAKSLAKRGFTVKFVDFFQLLTQLKAGYANDQADASLIQPLIDVDVLIIDELGKGKSSDWELSILDQLVMGRYNQKKIMVASTNYGLRSGKTGVVGGRYEGESGGKGFSLDELESLEYRVESRIYSRLLETSVFWEMSGDNYRQRLSSTLKEFSQGRKGYRHIT